jgi:thiosulfate reductase cytochrome b subunit
MNASTQRQVVRWIHIILSIPIFYFIYGPGASDPDAVRAVRFVFVPVVVLSGLWLWKGHVLVRRLKLIYRSHVAE